MIKKYRKKSLTPVEAIQAKGTPESNREIIDWTRGSLTPASMCKNAEDEKKLSIAGITDGAYWVSPGDFIIKGYGNVFYHYSQSSFNEDFEEVK